MKIAWISNAAWTPTGYGQQTGELAPRLKADGHDVAVMANYGVAGSVLDWQGIPHFPHGLDPFSNDTAPYQAADWTQGNSLGWTISLYDVWSFKGPAWDLLNVAAWVPIDHQPITAPVLAWFTERQGRRYAIAMSRFGEDQLLKAGVPRERVFYAPHSINTQVFKPTESDARKQMGIPEDAHLTMINAANKGNVPIRKCWPEMLLAWRTFAEKHPDAYLYLHTEVTGIANGCKIDRFLEAINAPMDRVKIVPQYAYKNGIPQEVLVQLYSAADVFLATSRGEGFGIPVVEAQACGVPVITTAWTAQPELTGAGWVVDGQPEWDEQQGGWWKVPNVDSIVAALESSYAAKGDTDLQRQAVEFAQGYDTATVYEAHWRPILARLASEVGGATNEPLRPANRAARRAQGKASRR